MTHLHPSIDEVLIALNLTPTTPTRFHLVVPGYRTILTFQPWTVRAISIPTLAEHVRWCEQDAGNLSSIPVTFRPSSVCGCVVAQHKNRDGGILGPES